MKFVSSFVHSPLINPQVPIKIPKRILKDFAYILADPVATIFNKSLSTGVVPRIWKEANVIPIPKCNQPESESDTRPISLTPGLSKVLEDFCGEMVVG